MSKHKHEENDAHIEHVAAESVQAVGHSHHVEEHQHDHSKSHEHGAHGHHGPRPTHGIYNAMVLKKVKQKKFHLPVIGHFANKSVEFSSIYEAWRATGIHYSLIFEACIGKIFKAKNVIWEFKKGNHYIKYKAFYINASTNYKRKVGFNG